jgi:hypothetical protein
MDNYYTGKKRDRERQRAREVKRGSERKEEGNGLSERATEEGERLGRGQCAVPWLRSAGMLGKRGAVFFARSTPENMAFVSRMTKKTQNETSRNKEVNLRVRCADKMLRG